MQMVVFYEWMVKKDILFTQMFWSLEFAKIQEIKSAQLVCQPCGQPATINLYENKNKSTQSTTMTLTLSTTLYLSFLQTENISEMQTGNKCAIS